MLAQNFKSAAELGITEPEFRSLITVLGMFEREEIPPEKFNMRTVNCGTAACIMGWCKNVSIDNVFLGDSRDVCVRQTELYQGLFLFGRDLRLRKLLPAQAATALRSYLTTGDARWDLAVA